MKLYEKTIDNVRQCKPLSKIVLIKDDMQIFNPTEEMILADGWIEYISPVQVITDKQKMLSLKEQTKIDAEKYGSSDEVDVFIVKDVEMWLDKLTRAGLMLRFQSEKILGKTETILWYKEMEFTLNIDDAMQMLYALEAYASECYDNTQRHLAQINKLTSIDELQNYDYTTGYPEKLVF